MGTRNCTWVRQDGKDVVGQYGQWDGYFTGQGHTVFMFIHQLLQPGMMNRFKENLGICYQPTDEERKANWVAAGMDPNNTDGFVSMDVSNKHGEMFPTMTRDTGAGVLRLILTASPTGNKIPLNIESEEELKEAWIEYSYRLDLDEEKLYIYCGCGGKPYKTMTFQEVHDIVHEAGVEVLSLEQMEDMSWDDLTAYVPYMNAMYWLRAEEILMSSDEEFGRLDRSNRHEVAKLIAKRYYLDKDDKDGHLQVQAEIDDLLNTYGDDREDYEEMVSYY